MKTRKDLRENYQYLVDLGSALLDEEIVVARQLFLYHRKSQEATWLMARGGGFIDDLYISVFSYFDTRLTSTHHLRESELEDADYFYGESGGKGTLFNKFLIPFGGHNFCARKFRIDNDTDLIFNAIFANREAMKNTEHKQFVSCVAGLLAETIKSERDRELNDVAGRVRISPQEDPGRATLLLDADLRIVDQTDHAMKLMSASNAILPSNTTITLVQPLDRIWLEHAITIVNDDPDKALVRNIMDSEGKLAGSFKVEHAHTQQPANTPFEKIKYIITFQAFRANIAASSAPSILNFPPGSSHSIIAALLCQGASRGSISTTLNMSERRVSKEIGDLLDEVGAKTADDFAMMTIHP